MVTPNNKAMVEVPFTLEFSTHIEESEFKRLGLSLDEWSSTAKRALISAIGSELDSMVKNINEGWRTYYVEAKL